MSADPSALVAEATRCFAAGQLDDVEALCRRALDEAPDHAAAQRQLAVVLVLRGAFEPALVLLAPLVARLPDDADLRLAHAEALWGTRSAAAALAEFRAAAALAPDRPRLRLRLGQALLAAGDADAAREILLDAVAALPDSAVALSALGSAEAATGALDAAVARFAAAAACDPNDADAAFQHGQTLRALGRTEQAIVALAQAVILNPASALLQLALGDALHASGQLEPALQALREAVRLAPEWALAWSALGRTVQKRGDVAEAITYYETARGLGQGMPELDAIIGNALLESGAATEAYAHFARSMAQASWNRPDGAARERLRVGVLLAPGPHNTPTTFILDPSSYDIEFVFMLDGLAYPPARIAASYDVVFNAIGDCDRARDALALAETLAATLPMTIVNAPRAVADTARDRMVERLAGIAGCTVPRTHRIAAAALSEAAARALGTELGWPLLARPVGSHGGDDLAKLAGPADLVAYAAGVRDALYVTAFHDFRSTDGRYRKYRLIVVGGEVFPYHLAIGADWLVHYFRTDMGADPDLRAEEARFLADYRAALGPAAVAALDEIVRRIDLDFFGIDATLTRGGDLLVFECNAAMLVHAGGTDTPLFAYKKAPAERIRAAVGRLLAGRGSQGDARGGGDATLDPIN